MALTIGSFLRGIESEHPISAFQVLSFFYLIISLLNLGFLKRRSGADFIYPWIRTDGSKKFSWTQLLALICGGAAEFVSGLFLLINFNVAAKANLNQGICTAIGALVAVEVTILSFAFFREIPTKSQLVGILFVVAAIFVLSLLGPKQSEKASVVSDESSGNGISLVIILGLVHTAASTTQILIGKWLMVSRGVSGEISGTIYMIV